MKLHTDIELRQLKKIQGIAGIGYWVYNYGSQEMWWSDNTYKILGYSDFNFSPSRHKLLQHIHPEDVEFFEEAIHQMQKQVMEFEFRFYRNGELRLGKVTGEVYQKEDKIEEVLFQDITDIKIKEFEIAKAWNKALEAENLKNAFLANMSHELRTPLNSIIGFSEMLETGNIQDDIEIYANSIKHSGLKLLKIVEDLLKVSMLESRTSKPLKRNFNISLLLDGMKKFCQNKLEKAGKQDIKLKFSNKKYPNLVIQSDQTKISGILKNLLDNAIKFTEKGSISCSFKIENRDIQFTVSDTGKGIPADQQNNVFQRFRKANDTKHKISGGTGLGLYISRLEIELLGGKIWMASEKDLGTTIHFRIPDVLDHEIEEIQKTESIHNWENYTVLIAEDQITNYKILEAYLQPTNINIIWAKTGREAIMACHQMPEINLVLMDINMPHTNGLEATRCIKEKHPNLNIIAQTAYALEGDRERSLNAGCCEHLAKPFQKTDLLNSISRFLP